MNAFARPRLAFWTDAEELECCSVQEEAPNVMTFSFHSPSAALFSFEPGQFLTLELPVAAGEEPLYRTYTISSSPSRPASISVTVKAQPGSIGTRWMFDHLRPGMRIRARGPSGSFSMGRHPAAKYLFLSAGSGITPMMSMAAACYDSGGAQDIVFVNCARRPSEIIFRNALEQMSGRMPSLDLKWVVEQADPGQSWTGYRGFFSAAMLQLMAPDYREREIFCCGPEPFMDAARGVLQSAGCEMGRYHQESFGTALLPGDNLTDPLTPDQISCEVTFAKSGKSASCAGDATILAAARAAGVRLPTGCGQGICGTCRVQKLSGEVVLVNNGGLTEDDIEEGYILACCAKPLGAVEIDL